MCDAIDDHAAVRTIVLRGGMYVRHLVDTTMNDVLNCQTTFDRAGIANPEHRSEIGVIKFAKITYLACADTFVLVIHEFGQG